MAEFTYTNPKTGVEYKILVDLEDLPRIISFGKWGVNEKGYVRSQNWIDGKNKITKLHRFVMNAKTDDPKVDHINGNKLDNQKHNLRFATDRQNFENLNNTSGGSSQYRGVTWDKKAQKWRAGQRIDRKMHYVGYFDSEDEAHAAIVQFRLDRGLEPGFEPEQRKSKREQDRSTWAKPVLPVQNNRGTSKYRGVSYSKRSQKYQAQVVVEGKRHHCGWFESEEDAYQAVVNFRRANLI